MKRKIYFEDQGQDFLWWIIDEHGNVIDCGPFQASVWVGNTVQDHTLMEGQPLQFISRHDQVIYELTIMVESIETIE